MSGWSGYLFGASIFLGAAIMMLSGQVAGWWSVVSIVIMLAGASTFLIRSAVEYRRSRGMAHAPQNTE